jgi:hypothetical protein
VCTGRVGQQASAAGESCRASCKVARVQPSGLACRGGDPLSQWKAARLEFLRLHPWPEIDPVDWLQETVRQIRRASGF